MQPVAERVSICGLDTEMRICGEGRPLLYLHSGDGIKRELDFISKLSALGRVYAPSHPGFGTSERPDDFKTVEDIAYFYLDFIKQSGLTDITLMGSSVGGWIACEMAVRATECLRNIVLIDTVGARFSDRDTPDIADIYMMPDADRLSRSFCNPDAGRLDIANSTDGDLIEVSRNRIALCQYAWSPYMNNPRLKRWLHRIDRPTLLIWGAQDQIVSPDYGRCFAAGIPGAKFALVEQAGHFPQVEQGEGVLRLVSSFVANEAGTAATLVDA